MNRLFVSFTLGLLLLAVLCALTGFAVGGEGGSITSKFHYWASFVLLAGGLVGLAYGFWAKVYEESPRLWVGAIVLFLASFLGQVTGNLLPMEQHDVQTAVIEAGIAGRVPLIGEQVRELILAGTEFSTATVERWGQFHRMGVGALLVSVVALLVTSVRRPLNPLASLVPIVLACVLCGLPAPSGLAATELDYTSYDAKPSWYTLPLHGLLRMSDEIGLGWIGACVVPGIIVAFLGMLPLMSRRVSTRSLRGTALGIVLLVGVAIVGWGEKSAPISGPQWVATRDSLGDSITLIDEGLVAKGSQHFLSKGCVNCHRLGAVGKGSISLDSMAQKEPNPEWYVRFIRDPQSVRPGSTMPAFPSLTQDELRALAEFVRQPRGKARE